jgi:hypothetical protein
MLILTEETDNLQVVLAGAVTTNQLQCVASWRDITVSAYTPGRTVVATNSTTDVNIVPAPAASTQRVIDMLSIYNADTVAATVTVKLDANGTEYILYKEQIASGEFIKYSDSAGWQSQGYYAPVQVRTIHADGGANFTLTNSPLAERFALNTTRAIFLADLAGYSQVRVITNVIVSSASGSTPAVRIRYYTGYSGTFANYLQLGASAHVDISLAATGIVDTGWVALAAGAKADGVAIATCELGGDGVIDPALGMTTIFFR